MGRPVRLELHVEIREETIGTEPGRRSQIGHLDWERVLTLPGDVWNIGPIELPNPGPPPTSVYKYWEVDLPTIDVDRLHLIIFRHQRKSDAGTELTIGIARREVNFASTRVWTLDADDTIELATPTYGTIGAPEDHKGTAPAGFTLSSGRYGLAYMKFYETHINMTGGPEVSLSFVEFMEGPEDLVEMWP